MDELNDIFLKQKGFYQKNKTLPVQFRIEQLIKIRELLKKNEDKLDKAIFRDLKKSAYDNYSTELGIIYKEISLVLKNLTKWTKPKKVKTNIANYFSSSYIIPEPLGVCLVIGAWNYPYQLTLAPSVAAIGAGNTVILKPSEISVNSSNLIAELVNNEFQEEIFHVINGGVDVTTELLKNKFDKIFFTGSTAVGKIIMKSAADNLTPVTLELGGKSPVFVLKDANLSVTARRIVWGKFINGGQTCVAPDYLLADEIIYEELLEKIKNETIKIFGESYSDSENSTKIINKSHYMRLKNLIDERKLFYGGKTNDEMLMIDPTILRDIDFSDKIMEEEIFGPVLPIIKFNDLDDTIKKVKSLPKPLSLYVFSANKLLVNKIITEIPFGGGAVNDTVMHFVNPNLPFGGIGDSGIGSYHGVHGFNTFSHFKSILDKSTIFEPFIKYPPYNKFKKSLLKLFLEKL